MASKRKHDVNTWPNIVVAWTKPFKRKKIASEKEKKSVKKSVKKSAKKNANEIAAVTNVHEVVNEIDRPIVDGAAPMSRREDQRIETAAAIDVDSKRK